MPIINNSFTGKLNLDVDPYRVSDGDYLDALNITRDAQGENQDKIVSNILGNTEISYSLPSGTNKVIGFFPDKIRNRAYYFIWNSNGNNNILYYDANANTIVKVLTSKTDSDGIDILNFNPSYKVLSVNIFYRDTEGDILYFNDGYNPPKSINVTANYGTSWKLEYLLIAKAPPVMPPKVVYENDPNVTTNNLRNALFQFSYRYVYDNNEKSVWSSNSIVPLPQQPTLNSTQDDFTLNSRISISVSTGGADIKSLELSFREDVNGVTSDWFLIKSISKSENSISDNDIYTYKFYNDSIYSQIDVIETTQLQSWVPQKANAAELANGNVLLYSGITEGYNKTNMDLIANWSSTSPLPYFYDQCGLLFFATCNGTDSGSIGTTLKIYLYGTGTNTSGEVTTLNNPIGNYVVNVANSSYVNIGATYTNLSATQTVANILGGISSALVANGFGWTQVSLVGNVLTMSNTSAFTLYSSGTQYTYSGSGYKDNTEFANAWDSGYQYGLQYFDAQGRTIGTQISKLSTFNTPSNDGDKFPQTFLQIKNRPPLEAIYYQVVRSNTTTYNKLLYWISTGAYRSPLSLNTIADVYDLESFAYIDITNLTDYNIQQPTTSGVISYNFTPGDRIKFLKKYNALGNEVALTTILDAEILGTESTVLTTVGQKEGKFIKIKYPAAAVLADPNLGFDGTPDFLHYEIFLYNYTTNSDITQKAFYEFGKCFGIGNPGTTNAYHIGLEQTQSATNPSVVPAIINGTNGDMFYRKRNVPFNSKVYYQAGGQSTDIMDDPQNLLAQMVMNFNSAAGSSAYSNANYATSAQINDTAIYPSLPASYPTFSDNGFFYNKTAGSILLGIKFNVQVVHEYQLPHRHPGFYAVYVTSAGVKTYSQIYTSQIISSDTLSAAMICDTKINVPANTKVWIGLSGQSSYFPQFNLELDIYQSKTIEIIEKSFTDTYNLFKNSNGRASVIDENAKQVYFPTLIRFSQAYQVNTNINGTNNFYYENFDEYDRSFGDVMRLHVRDRYLKVYQKFKVGNVPILTQIVKDVQGNPLQANTDQLINKIQYYAGEYGIGDASTSLAWNNFADYFVDNYRGVVCRLSQDGITPISITNATNAFFTANTAAYRQDLNNGIAPTGSVYKGNPCIYGVFDSYTNKYIIAMEEINRYSNPSTLLFHQDPYTISFDEIGNAFESFYSYHPEFMGDLNITLFTFDSGKIYKHTSNTHCNFYGIQYPATITTVFNSGALDKKTWISLMETGNTIWKTPIIYTQMNSYGSQKQESQLLDADFEVLESEYHASFLRDSNSIGGLLEGDALKGGYIVIKFEKTNANSFVYLNSATVKFIDSPLNNR